MSTKTVKAMISWRIFNWPNAKDVLPIRFAGTCSMYSKKAIPQLANAATIHGLADMFFRCPYHAKVMKRLLNVRRAIVVTVGGTRRTFLRV